MLHEGFNNECLFDGFEVHPACVTQERVGGLSAKIRGQVPGLNEFCLLLTRTELQNQQLSWTMPIPPPTKLDQIQTGGYNHVLAAGQGRMHLFSHLGFACTHRQCSNARCR